MGPTSRRLADDLASHLRNRLVSGEYAANSAVSETGVATEYGVARPTARAAMEVLIEDGLLVRQAHLPPRVPDISPDDLIEIIKLLEVTEHMALERLLSTARSGRSVFLPADEDTTQLLNTMSIASGSERLAWIHRRTTFELLLAFQQHQVVATANFIAAERDARQTLCESVAHLRPDEAKEALVCLHRVRRDPVNAFLGTNLRLGSP